MSDKQGIDLNSCVLLYEPCRIRRIFVQIPYRCLEETCKKTLALSNNSVNYGFIMPCHTVLKVYIIAEKRTKREGNMNENKLC